ncbi:MAG: hypothetical protein EXR92_05425 [Gemmatimonadetes bacterium]|nr:hypothetical protein [Gemmatimonadota bacterium]
MSQLRHLSRFAVAIPALLLTACGGDSPPAESAPQAGAPAATPAAPATPGEIRVALTPQPGFTATGTLRLVRDGDNFVAEAVAETHMNQGDYPMYIREGNCAGGGRVVVPLTAIQGQESGEGTAKTTFPAAQLPPAASYFVSIHGPTGSPVACADLPAVNL